jgi:hypothetical protein
MIVIPRKQYTPTPQGRTLPKGLGWVWWKGSLFIECPSGHRAAFDLSPNGHQVAADGTISPSAVCPETGCTFHEFVRLADWTPEPPPEDA